VLFLGLVSSGWEKKGGQTGRTCSLLNKKKPAYGLQRKMKWIVGQHRATEKRPGQGKNDCPERNLRNPRKKKGHTKGQKNKSKHSLERGKKGLKEGQAPGNAG